MGIRNENHPLLPEKPQITYSFISTNTRNLCSFKGTYGHSENFKTIKNMDRW